MKDLFVWLFSSIKYRKFDKNEVYKYNIYNKDGQIEGEKKKSNPCIQEFPKYIKNVIV